MKKYQFDQRPELVEMEGATVRINFDVEEVEQTLPPMGDEEPVVKTVFEAYVVRVQQPVDLSKVIDAIVTAEYPNDRMQAVVNNYLANQKDAERKQEFNDMQNWRAHAKEIATEAIEALSAAE
jgi:hypothetical protein